MDFSSIGNRGLSLAISGVALAQIPGNMFYPAAAALGVSVLIKNDLARSSINMGLCATGVYLGGASPLNLTLLALSAQLLSYKIARFNKAPLDRKSDEVASNQTPLDRKSDEAASYLKEKLERGVIVLDTDKKRDNCFMGQQIRNLSYDNLLVHVDRVGLENISVPTAQGFFDAYQRIKEYYEVDKVSDFEGDDFDDEDLLQFNFRFLSKIFDGLPQYSN